MNEYLSSFVTGFAEIISDKLPQLLPGTKILGVWDGLVYYRYPGDFKKLKTIPFLNNTFAVLQFFPKKPAFAAMVSAAEKGRFHCLIDRGSFRVRFSKENQFASVPKALAVRAENAVRNTTRLRVDRVSPQTEFWYLIRREGMGFYGQLLHKRESTEKNLAQGELRPEFAYLMCCCAQLGKESIVCDPFCGFGGIAKQLAKSFPFRKLLLSDIDGGKIVRLQEEALSKNSRVNLSRADALSLTEIPDQTIDLIITDPPWGYYEQIDDIGSFYDEMLQSFSRVLKKGGAAVVLSARKAELEASAQKGGVPLCRRIDTLVNGKKAAVFVLYCQS